jgi:hypothetical protein
MAIYFFGFSSFEKNINKYIRGSLWWLMLLLGAITISQRHGRWYVLWLYGLYDNISRGAITPSAAPLLLFSRSLFQFYPFFLYKVVRVRRALL